MSNTIGYYDNILVRIAELDDEALGLFKEFEKENFNSETALYTKIGYADSFQRFLRFYDDPIKTITMQNLRDYKAETGDKTSDFYLKQSSAAQHIIRVRKVLQFISDECDLKQNFYEVKAPKSTIPEIDETELISNEEMKLILQHATHPRDKALFSMLHESGVRISELLNLRIGDIKDMSTHIEVSFRTLKRRHTRKKKIRTIIIVNSQSFVLEWLHTHPFKSDPDAWFFIALKEPHYGNRLSYSTTYGTLRKICKRAGIRSLNLHLFRHTRVSRDVRDGWAGEGLNAKHGWRKGSRTGARYTHLGDPDLVEMQRKQRGLATETTVETEPTLVDMISCPRCNLNNPKDNLMCSRCFSSLSGITVEERILEVVKKFLKERYGYIAMERNGDLKMMRPPKSMKLKELKKK